jgi:tetratricopeptide (TPR) repeat protein
MGVFQNRDRNTMAVQPARAEGDAELPVTPVARRRQDPSYEDQVRAAVDLHGGGRLGEAEARYRALLDHPQAQSATLHFVLGLLLDDSGRTEGALAEYDLAAAHGYATADLFERRGDRLRSSGRWADALADYDRAATLRPDHARTIHHRAITLAALNRPLEALEAYDRALALRPDDAPILNNRGVTLEGLGRLDEAIAGYDRALAIQGDYSFAHHNRGSALLKLKQFEAAAASFRRALTGAPGRPESWNLLGMALGGLLQHREALIAFDEAVALRPAYAEAMNNRSIALRWVGRFEEAIASADAALALDPQLADALVSRGGALARLNRHREALEDYEAALALRPDSAPALLSRGLAREALGDIDGALADFAAADGLAPTSPDPKVCMGLAHIRRGAFYPGFSLYKWRWRKSDGPFAPHPRSALWTGAQPVAGRTVLLYGEQGFGDVIQFCRFAADVAGLGAHVVLQVQPALQRLAQTLVGPAQVLTLDQPAPASDLHAPLMDLPAVLGLSLQDVPRPGAYLSAPDLLTGAWADQLGPRDRPRIGLAWSGNPLHENDHNRSAPFEAMAPLFETRATFVSLQKTHRLDELREIDRRPTLRRLDDDLVDFADVAAVVACCDAVVAVDTAVAHLAGAMGRPVHILLPRCADWRWMDGRPDSPWYPSARLLRQHAFGDWSAPVAAAAAAVSAL